MFSEDKTFVVKTLNVCDNIGYFCVMKPAISESLYWDSCREIFAKNFNEDSLGFYYVVDYKKVDYIMKFILDVESILNIDHKTKFYRTNKENILAVLPSQFWMRCFVRRSLLTLLFRVSFFHEESSTIENTLFDEIKNKIEPKIDSNKKDVIKTKSAVIRFLLGHNKFVGSKVANPDLGPWKHGWVEEFADKTNSQLKRLLVSEKVSLSELFFSE